MAHFVIEQEGKLVDEYPVDELSNPNCGDAKVYLYEGKYYEIITWNDYALEHEEGEITCNEIEWEE